MARRPSEQTLEALGYTIGPDGVARRERPAPKRKPPASVSGICVLAPVRTQSEANAREHWSKRSKRAAEHRQTAANAVGPLWRWRITLTRIAPRKLDDDNLARALKAVRDGVADALGLDDGDERLTWRYAQRKGEPKQYAVEVRIEAVAND